ncbi:hypothetical protein MRX96_019420 [Rhipicephalus microplus]
MYHTKIQFQAFEALSSTFVREYVAGSSSREISSGFEGAPTTLAGATGGGFGVFVRGARRHRAADNVRWSCEPRLWAGVKLSLHWLRPEPNTTQAASGIRYTRPLTPLATMRAVS